MLLHNARVLTFHPARRLAHAVAVREGRIAAAGSFEEAARAVDADAERIDCEGGALLPAFIDAHCHLLAFAASLRSVDCTAARSIPELQALVRARAAETPAGGWVRAFGYEETALAERRHPTRHELDAAAPGHPVRLIHRSGHASVLNTPALRAAGIATDTEEPPGGAIDRELPSGEPSGLLIEMEDVIERATPPLAYQALAAAVREASARFLAAGITCIEDASHTNGRDAWELFERLIADGALPLRVVMMEGIDHLGELPEAAADGRLTRGATKIVLRELGGALAPDEPGLARRVFEAHAAGRQVAVHAVGARAVEAAARAIEEALRRRPRDGHRHRIEHASDLPGGLAPRLAALGITVVSQPAVVYERGQRYLELVPERDRERLYAFRALSDAGVALAAGSDAPVTAPDALASVAAAVERRTAAGRLLAAGQAVEAEQALGWWTAGAARAAFLEGERGMVRPGCAADLVLLSKDPTGADQGELREISVRRVWLNGRVP
jgi:hypothetical protein